MLVLCDNAACRSGRHWTRRQADECYSRGLIYEQELLDGTFDDRWRAEQQHDFERRMEAVRLKNLASELDGYQPEAAWSPAGERANESGERQLRALRDHLHAIGSLSFVGAYDVNLQLRTGRPHPLNGMAADICGASSCDVLIAWATDAFAALGDEVQLDVPVQALRGDTTLTHDLLNRSPGDEFVDPGYVFASLARSTADFHLERAQELDDTHRPALVTLNLHAALYIPPLDQRSRELREIGDAVWTFSRMAEQFIVPAGSRWRVNSVTTSSPDGIVRADLTQLP